jgi:large subunit ribosomal protein L30
MTEKSLNKKPLETKVEKKAEKKVVKPAIKTSVKPDVKATKKVHTGETVTIKQIRSAARRNIRQTYVLEGLGLNKIGRTKTLPDNPCIRGMIEKVKHLLEVVK